MKCEYDLIVKKSKATAIAIHDIQNNMLGEVSHLRIHEIRCTWFFVKIVQSPF